MLDNEIKNVIELIVIDLARTYFSHNPKIISSAESFMSRNTVKIKDEEYIVIDETLLQFICMVTLLEAGWGIKIVELNAHHGMPNIKVAMTLNEDEENSEFINIKDMFTEFSFAEQIKYNIDKNDVCYGVSEQFVKRRLGDKKSFIMALNAIKDNPAKKLCHIYMYGYLNYLFETVKTRTCAEKIVNKAQFMMLFLSYPELIEKILNVAIEMAKEWKCKKIYTLDMNEIDCLMNLVRYIKEFVEIKPVLEKCEHENDGVPGNQVFLDYRIEYDSAQYDSCQSDFASNYNDYKIDMKQEHHTISSLHWQNLKNDKSIETMILTKTSALIEETKECINKAKCNNIYEIWGEAVIFQEKIIELDRIKVFLQTTFKLSM